MARVRWSIEEQQAIIEEAALILSNKQAFSMREAFTRAQSKLPKHRQREIAALSQVPWYTDAVPQRMKELDAAKHKTLEEKLAAGIAEARDQERDRLEHQFAQKAGALFAKVLMYALEDPALRARLFVYLPNVPIAMAPKTSREKRLKVVIAGPLNSQARTLEEKYSDALDLRFWSKDQSHDSLKQMLAHADVAVGMVSFLPHSADGILKTAKIPYHPVSGGMTHMKQQLDKLV